MKSEDKIELAGKLRDRDSFKAMRNTSLFIITCITILALLTHQTTASPTIANNGIRVNGQNGTFFNPSTATSGFPLMNINNQVNYTAGTNISIEVWVMINETGVSTTNYGIVGENAVMGLFRNNNNINFQFRNTTNFGAGSSTPVILKQIIQYLAVFNGTHSLLYQNGTLLDSDALDMRNQKNATNGISIYSSEVASGNLNYTIRNDTLYSVRWWNKSLTQAEITEQFNRGASRPTNITTALIFDLVLNSTNSYFQNTTQVNDLSFARSTTIYINNTNTFCNDSYTRAEATSTLTSWCLPSSTTASKISSGDYVLIANSNYNSRFNFLGYNYTTPVIIAGQSGDGVIITNIDTDFNKTNNGAWTNASSSSNFNIWKSTSSGVDEFATAYFANGTGFFIYANISAFNSSSNQYEYSMYADDTNNVIYLKSNYSIFNPNNYSLYVMGSNYDIMSFDTINGQIELHNLTIKYFKWGIYLENISHLKLENISAQFGTRTVRGKDSINTNLTINNSYFNSYFNPDWFWQDLHKPTEVYSETKAVANANVHGSVKIQNTLFTNWSNGLTLTHSNTRWPSVANIISGNEFINIYDDSIELENKISNWTVFNNTGYDSFVSLSLAPANCTGTCQVSRNAMIANKTIRYNATSIMNPYNLKFETQGSDRAVGWNFSHNTWISTYANYIGIDVNAVTHTNFTNEIFYANQTTLRQTGYANNRLYFNNNLHYRYDGNTPLLNAWNNNTGNLNTLAAALASAYWDGTWDTNSFEANPQLDQFLRPNYNSLACGNANDGEDIGAYDCLSEPSTLTLFVNVSHSSCSDGYSRGQASDPSTPWCDISAAETYAQNGDTVIIADGVYRDFDTYNFNANWNSTVTFQAQSNNTIITASQSSSCEVSGNSCWTNASNSTHTNFWSRSIATGSTSVGVTYINTSQPLLRCSNNNMSLTYSTRGFECTWFNTTSQVLFLSLAPNVNPNQVPFYIWKGDTISLDAVTNVAFKGFTIVGGEQLVSTGSGQPKNITFENNKFLGGYSDSGAVDIRRVDGLDFINNTLFRTQLTSWWWFMIKQSNLGGETAGLYCQDGCNNTRIINNTIANYFNGIVMFNLSAGNLNNIYVSNNNITNIVDDGIEFEGYGNNITIFNNTIYDSFVAISLTSFNNTAMPMDISFNQLHSVKRINYTKSGSTFTTIQGESFKLLANNSLYNANINHNSMYGDRNIACRASSTEVYTNCMTSVNITNNLMLSENNYVLDGSGLNSSKVYYNNNLYFNASGGSNIFRYWNSNTNNLYTTLAQAKASSDWSGTWDTASLNIAPLVANFLVGNFTPDGNSPLNGSASDGTYIGAVAPGEFIYVIVNVTITSANNTNLTGVSILQVNYTVGGSEPTYCDIYLDGVYHTNLSTPTAGAYSSTITNTNVGTHTYYITCYDESLSSATSGVYSFFYEKALINGTRSSYVGSDTNCVGSNCATGSSTLAFDGNLTTKANYIVGSSQYITNLYSNYTNPNGILAAKLYYFLYCTADSSGTFDLSSNYYSSGKIMLNGYLVDTGFKANYLAVYNGTDYENIGGTYICGTGGSGTHGYYETYVNYTLNYAINFSNTNNSYGLRNQNTNIIANLLNPGSLGNSITYNLKVYNSTNSIIYTTSFNSTQNNISVPVNFTTNGIYTYNITAENTTHYAISELYTLNIYDFTTTFTSPINNQNFNNTLLINWTNSFTGGSSYTITGTNITIDGRLIANLAGNTSVYEWNNTYNYNLTLGIHTIAVNVYDSSGTMTNTTTTANHTYNTRINITAKTAIGGSTINTYSGWVYESASGINVSYSTTTGQALVDFLRGNITVFIDATNYSIVNTTNFVSFNLTTGFYDQTFYLYETNALNITFYDEVNPSVLLTGVSINLELISDTFSGSYNTTNGTMYLPLLIAETYTLRYTAPRYTTRFYTVTITNETFQNIQLYLVNSTIANNISIYVVNQVLNPVEGAVVKALKYNLPTNSYILQEIGTTDVNGRVIMTLTMNDEYYKFIVEYPSGNVKTITDPAYISSTTQTIGIDFTRDITEEYQNYKSITYDLTFNTLSNNFRLDYTDSNNLASQYCLYVYKLNNATQELYGVDCETGSSGTILVPVENATGVVYEAKAVYTENGVQKFLTSLIKEFPWINALANQFGIFLQILISLAFASLFILNAGIAIIGLGFSLILGKLLGLTLFGWGGLVAIQIVCLIIGIILAMKK